MPLPMKWIIEFGEPIYTDDFPDNAAGGPMLVQPEPTRVRETDPARRSGKLCSSSAAPSSSSHSVTARA